MNILYFFESIRTPFLDTFFSMITKLGEEYVFLVIALLFVWCINKKAGYIILLTGLFGQAVNQFIKTTCKVDRPWVADPNFKPVESAIKEAIGYSFPSGHTQISTTTYLSIAVTYKHKKVIFITFSIFTVLVAVSRLYLGVHYLSDVLFSLIFGVVVVLLTNKYFDINRCRVFKILTLSTAVALFAYILFISRGKWDDEFIYSAVTTTSKFFGATLGFVAAWIIDEKCIKFETSGSILFQIIKLTVGFIITVFLKEAVKIGLEVLHVHEIAANIIRYSILVLFAGAVWPFLFTKIKKLSPKFSTTR